jgi:hypothetical protein
MGTGDWILSAGFLVLDGWNGCSRNIENREPRTEHPLNP